MTDQKELNFSKNNPLINISKETIGNTEMNSVNARELWVFLESRQDFSDWIKGKINKYQFTNGKDFTSFHKNIERVIGSSVLKEYIITLDMAKELAMVENNAKGRQAYEYLSKYENNNNDNIVEIINNIAVTSSRRVAKMFGKRHDHVLRDIGSLKISTDFRVPNFGETYWTDSQQKTQREYILTRDGFMILAMGYTGEKAMKLKEDYIYAFNTMEKKLRSLPPTKELSYDEIMLKALTMADEKVKALEYENKSQKSLIDQAIGNNGLIDFRHAAKLLNDCGEKKLFAYCRWQGYIDKNNIPLQDMINAKNMDSKIMQVTIGKDKEGNEKTKDHYKPYFTKKGFKWIEKKWTEHKDYFLSSIWKVV